MNRRPFLTALRTAAALVVVGTVTGALAQQSASGAFSAVTAVDGGTVGSAADFCTAAGTVAAPLAADAWIEQNDASSNHGIHQYLYVEPGVGQVRRSLLKFTMPPAPAGCEVSSATLRLYNDDPRSARVVHVHQISPAAGWSQSTVTWLDQPAITGSAASSTAGAAVGWQEWTVTGIVGAIYGSSANNGVMLRDAAENETDDGNRYASQDLGGVGTNAGTAPQLSVTWG
jgi:hypothetical protein